MHKLHATFLGLALYATAGAPLFAQDTVDTQARAAAEPAKKFSAFTDNLGPDYYVGIPMTETEAAKLRALRRKQLTEVQNLESLESMNAAWKRHVDEIHAQLTPAQQKVVARNQQILAALGYAGGISKMFMGVGLTDEQLSAVKKVVAGRENELDRRMIDASYAVLTPEQQKVAAPQYEQLKAHHDIRAKVKQLMAERQP